jgi:hypothetical protein
MNRVRLFVAKTRFFPLYVSTPAVMPKGLPVKRSAAGRCLPAHIFGRNSLGNLKQRDSGCWILRYNQIIHQRVAGFSSFALFGRGLWFGVHQFAGVGFLTQYVYIGFKFHHGVGMERAASIGPDDSVAVAHSARDSG